MSSQELIEQTHNLHQKIALLYVEIERLKKDLHATETKLFHTCEHEWIIDQYVCSEHTEYICKKCGLGNFPSCYQ